VVEGGALWVEVGDVHPVGHLEGRAAAGLEGERGREGGREGMRIKYKASNEKKKTRRRTKEGGREGGQRTHTRC